MPRTPKKDRVVQIDAVLTHLRDQEKVTTALVTALLKERARKTAKPKKRTKKRQR